MQCILCKSKKVDVEYKGIIRNGGLGQYTKKPVTMWKCQECEAIWHDCILDNEEYYESQEYRKSLEGTSKEEDFYRLHDKESLDKFNYTGTAIFRNKRVADIGCGAGAFLDYLSGVANEIVAIEPSETYREIMRRKGYDTYPYTSNALEKWKEKIDVAISFDVIEHVERPDEFLKEVFALIKKGGEGIIGTPTDAPIMRKLLGEIYEKKLLFSTQHIWVLGDKNLKIMAKNAGFDVENISVKYFQRYGIGNALGWLREKDAKSEIHEEFLTETLDQVWRSECAAKGMADYIVLYLKK